MTTEQHGREGGVASNTAKGKKQYNQALDAALVAEWKAWVATQAGGLTETQHLEMAMRRHMRYPPELPHVPELPVETKPKRGRK
jgi:hypothetical protein